MPINALPSGPGPLNGAPALPGGDRKGEEVQLDPAFAALLAALVAPPQGLPAGANLTGLPVQPSGQILGNTVAPVAGAATPPPGAAAGALPGAAEAFSLPTGMLNATPDQPDPLPQPQGTTPLLPTSQATRMVEALLAQATAQGEQPVQVLAVTRETVAPAPQSPTLTAPIGLQATPVVVQPTPVVVQPIPVAVQAAPVDVPATPVEVQPTPIEAVVAPTGAQAPLVQAEAAAANVLTTATVAGSNRPTVLPRPIAADRAQPEPATAIEPATASGLLGLTGRGSGERAAVAAVAAPEQKNARDGDRSLHQSRQPENLAVPVLQQQTPQADAQSDRLAARLPNPVDVSRLMETMPRALADAGPGNYTVTLQLHPEHLGEVKLQVQLIGQQVHTVMEVANTAARQALEANGDQLRQGLTQAGLTLAGFQVSTGQGGERPRDQQAEFAEQLQDGRRVTGVRPRTAQPAAPPRIIRDRTGARIDTLV